MDKAGGGGVKAATGVPGLADRRQDHAHHHGPPDVQPFLTHRQGHQALHL